MPKPTISQVAWFLHAWLVFAVWRALPSDEVVRTPVSRDEAQGVDAIRELHGQHVRLMTDVGAAPEVDELPRVFDAACPLWAEYFGVAGNRWRDWQVTGCLMRDESRFRRAGLLPAKTPPFLHGYAQRQMLWWRDQPSAYYRRHLMLHEGVHAFMQSFLGGSGPPWYREAMAELLATHRWKDNRLVLPWFPSTRDEVPMLGRIRLVQDAVAAGRGLSIEQIMAFTPRAFFQNENYAWCWALAALLEGHPAYRDRFRRLPRFAADRNFNRRFHEVYAHDWNRLQAEWRLYISGIEHGYDFQRTAIDFTPATALVDPTADVTIRADRGWQNTGLRLEAGHAYEITARGRYQVAKTTKPWWCEPGGVSIRYYKGRPLGVLLAGIAAGGSGAQWAAGLVRGEVVGYRKVIRPEQSGTLFLRVNESAGKLADNRGTLQVRVRRLKKANASQNP